MLQLREDGALKKRLLELKEQRQKMRTERRRGIRKERTYKHKGGCNNYGSSCKGGGKQVRERVCAIRMHLRQRAQAAWYSRVDAAESYKDSINWR